jgi:RimJ/RimL family protein N-acetyltransferase
MTVLQASRLLLRVPGEEDADFMLKLFSDPNVNRFLLSSRPYSREIILEGIARSQACYAFEAAAATLEYAFAKLGRDRVVAITHPENRASIRLAERIGMVNERKVLWKGKAAYLFSAKA